MKLTADKPAAGFRKSLSAWRRSTRYHDYRQTSAYATRLEAWLSQVANELLPAHPATALTLFESFIEADSAWFDHADDSGGEIGSVVRSACELWLEAASRSSAGVGGRADRLARLYDADEYGAREVLFSRAGRLLDETALRSLVTRYEIQMQRTLAAPRKEAGLPIEIYGLSAALSLLSEALRDPDVTVRATLLYSPQPNALQQETFVKAFLECDRPADALAWLREPWGSHEHTRLDLLAQTDERLGRYEDSIPIRRRAFERSPNDFFLKQWLAHLPESAGATALDEARRIALEHDNPVTGAALLVHQGDAPAAEARLIARAGRIDGDAYATLVPLAQAFAGRGHPRAETVIYRALVRAILDRGCARAYRHAAQYWTRVGTVAA